jgi:serine/threonine protein kinase
VCVRERERESSTHTHMYTLAFSLSLPFSIHTYIRVHIRIYMHTYIQVRILKALLHPHIIRLYEVVEEPYRRLIMMEYSAGINSLNPTP